mmetsp:Transcript_12652/g.27957  ORF Transcript_12652/g.27957 Transcript_12652/m.27957 type:complete len:80 (-) Transcript_12652:516-755(-)
MFRSYHDRRKILLTLESTVQAQKAYGIDIIIPLDELLSWWKASFGAIDGGEARSLREHLKDVRQQAMYYVVHGGVNREL